jgi:ribosomal protein S18 acetylase RimI-like enzyme
VDDAELLERMWPSMGAAFETVPRASPGGRLERRDGVAACIVPAVPERSVFNSVLYREAGALEAAYDELAHLYEEGGVRAWTVWVHPGDRDAAALLERAGHVLDATPRAMATELAGLGPATTSTLDWERTTDARAVAGLNDAAYGYGDAPFMRAFGDVLPGAGHFYLARLDGEPAACVGAFDAGGDCSIAWVATRPDGRGRGLASGLMSQALADARERGCATTSLQATKLGEPVYARLGYRALGAIEMWERRRP